MNEKEVEAKKIDSKVREQILKVRDTGETNMFDINAVMSIANDHGWYELVAFLSERENKRIYGNFILFGDEEDN